MLKIPIYDTKLNPKISEMVAEYTNVKDKRVELGYHIINYFLICTDYQFEGYLES